MPDATAPSSAAAASPTPDNPVAAAQNQGPSRFARGNAWFGLAHRSRDRQGRMRTRVVWPRLGILMLILMLAGWISGSIGIWAFLRFGQDFHNTSVVDIAFLPLHWRDYQRRRGDDYIERAVKLDQDEWRRKFFLLRVGVAKSPGNLEGRRLLAQLYGALGNAPAGLKVLENGLAQAEDNLPYIQTYLSLLIEAQQDDKVRAMADAALARPDLPANIAQYYALAGAWASYLSGDFTAAEQYLALHGVRSGAEGRLLQTRVEWEQGYRDLALARLRGMIDESAPGRPSVEAAHEQLFHCLRELGRKEEAADAAVLRTAAFPQSLEARLNLLLVRWEGGDRARLEREVERVLRDFPADARLVDRLGSLAMRIGDVALAERVAAMVRELNLSPEYATMLVLQTRLAAGEHEEVITGIQRLAAEESTPAPGQETWRAGLLAVAYFARGESDLAELNVGRLLSDHRARPEILFDIGVRLRGVHATDAARRVFARLVDSGPPTGLLQQALTNLVELEMQTNAFEDLPRHLGTLLAMRRPAFELLQAAYDELGSDRLLFSHERSALLEDLRAVLANRERALR